MTPKSSEDWASTAEQLDRALRLRSHPVALKLFDTAEDMESILRLRRPEATHTMGQIVAQAARLGWTVGATARDIVAEQCRAVVGLAADEAWRASDHMAGVWFASSEDARRHQAAMHAAPAGRHEAVVVAPLGSGRLDPPDIVLFYASPGAMIYFINGLQWSGYRPFSWSVVGESACADSWGRALSTGEPSLAIPCFAERYFGGVGDEEMLMATPPSCLLDALDGMRHLASHGFRYPFSSYGIRQDARAGIRASYPDLPLAGDRSDGDSPALTPDRDQGAESDRGD
jgi:uncharacterized protein (DUF169 family)